MWLPHECSIVDVVEVTEFMGGWEGGDARGTRGGRGVTMRGCQAEVGRNEMAFNLRSISPILAASQINRYKLSTSNPEICRFDCARAFLNSIGSRS